MKKFLVVGNPIKHTHSPKLHNFWFKKYNINAKYEQRLVDEKNLEEIIKEVREKKIDGINITAPFKQNFFNLVDLKTDEVEKTKSINTVYINDKGLLVGDNTDVGGFKESLKHINYDIKKKNVFIIGAGGVASSIITALKSLEVGNISITNRTKKKAINIKELFQNQVLINEIVEWGETPKFCKTDVVINVTSLGLNKNESIELDYEKFKPGPSQKKLFYDVNYNPPITNFLKKGDELKNQTENGLLMFLYQAQLAFKIWNGIKPEVNRETLDLLLDD